MALDSDTSATIRAREICHYRSRHIVVSTFSIRTAHGHYLVRDLHLVRQTLVFAHPARTTALICGAIELMLAVPLAVAYGSAALLGAGIIGALGLATALMIDGRRNPRWMALQAVHGGREIILFSSRDQREFGQVLRAVTRAVEACHPQWP